MNCPGSGIAVQADRPESAKRRSVHATPSVTRHGVPGLVDRHPPVSGRVSVVMTNSSMPRTQVVLAAG